MHGRFGNKFPRPEHSLTAAIAARCAAKTWYNERNPRRADITGEGGTEDAVAQANGQTALEMGMIRGFPVRIRLVGINYTVCA